MHDPPFSRGKVLTSRFSSSGKSTSESTNRERSLELYLKSTFIWPEYGGWLTGNVRNHFRGQNLDGLCLFSNPRIHSSSTNLDWYVFSGAKLTCRTVISSFDISGWWRLCLLWGVAWRFQFFSPSMVSNRHCAILTIATGGGGQTGLDILSFSNVSAANKNRYYAHVFVGWLFLGIQNCTLFLICRIHSLVSYSRTSSLQENSSGVSSTTRCRLSNRLSNNPSHCNSERYAFRRQVDWNLWFDRGESVH